MAHVLVIQHPNLAHLNLSETQAFFRLPAMPSGETWRIAVAPDFRLPAHLIAELNQAQCDFAVLPDLAFNQIKLIVSDMDSTLITIECIDEIAAAAGLKTQVSAITERAMRGELDFEQSLRSRVALLKGLPESVLQTVYDQTLQLTDGAKPLIEQCHQHNVTFILVSGGFTFFTNKLKADLGLHHAFANELEIKNGVLTGCVLGRIIDAQAKQAILNQFKQQINGYTVAIGDGANDILMLQAADFGVAFHAKPIVQNATKLAINHNHLYAVRNWFA